MRLLKAWVAAGVLAAPLGAVADDGPVLQRIAERGVVSACTNVENRPFAYLTPSGKAVGFNADLLENLRQSLSSRLGREISAQTIPTSGANRVPFVQQGKCDVIITWPMQRRSRRAWALSVRPAKARMFTP